jgi:hypothetical protein
MIDIKAILAIKEDGSKDLSKDLPQTQKKRKHINLPTRGVACRAKAQVGVRVASAIIYYRVVTGIDTTKLYCCLGK